MKTEIRIIFTVLVAILVVSTSIVFIGSTYEYELDFLGELSIHNEEKTIEILKAKGYTHVDNSSEHCVHYTREINGILSRDYFSLYYRDGKLYEIRWSAERAVKKALPIRFETKAAENIIQRNGFEYKLESTRKNVEYRNINNRMVPVEYNHNYYVKTSINSDSPSLINGFAETVCYNLNTGQTIDYESLCIPYPQGIDNYIRN